MAGLRSNLVNELRQLEGSMKELTKSQRMRVACIANRLCCCVCRACGKHYDNRKARGEYTGFCSAKCQHDTAKRLGYRKGKGRTEYQCLHDGKQIGNVFVVTDA